MSESTKCFFELLGWAGGTIHQVGDALGVDGLDLIHAQPDQNARLNSDYTSPSDFMLGQYAFDTCSISWVKEKLLPKYKGNLNFWLGYKRAAFLAAI